MKRAAPFLALPLLLGACTTAGDGPYPSLAVREAERVTGTLGAAEAEPFVPAPPPPATLDRIDALRATAAEAHEAFLAAVPATRSAVQAARGGAAGSEAWARAQVALSNLEAARSQAMIALADLDRLYVDAATAETDVTRIVAARDAVAAQVAEQDSTIGELLAALS